MAHRSPNLGAVAALTLLGLGAAAPVQAASAGAISKLANVGFANLDPTAAASSSQSICVYSASGLYTVTAAGDGAGSAFTLSAGGSVPPLPYSVGWATAGGQSAGTALTPGMPLTGLSTLAIEPTCLIGLVSSASVVVSFAPADLQQATAGLPYSGVLTLTIRAQ